MTVLGIYSEGLRSHVPTETCTRVFAAASFRVAKLGSHQEMSFSRCWVDGGPAGLRRDSATRRELSGVKT